MLQGGESVTTRMRGWAVLSATKTSIGIGAVVMLTTTSLLAQGGPNRDVDSLKGRQQIANFYGRSVSIDPAVDFAKQRHRLTIVLRLALIKHNAGFVAFRARNDAGHAFVVGLTTLV